MARVVHRAVAALADFLLQVVLPQLAFHLVDSGFHLSANGFHGRQEHGGPDEQPHQADSSQGQVPHLSDGSQKIGLGNQCG